MIIRADIITLSSTEFSPYLRIIRIPRGPTVTFKINSYTLMSDFLHMVPVGIPPPVSPRYQKPPLVLMNGFPDDPEYQIISVMLQGMFPPLNVKTVSYTTEYF
jgi:ribosome biogenesis protein SSF1/2